MNPFQPLAAAYAPAIKKVAAEALKGKYALHEQALERITSVIQTAKDYEAVGKLFLALYEAGFITAIDQHKAILEKHGLSVNIVATPNATPQENSIFIR